MENTTWLIWSIEHGAWWASNHRGYTTIREEAGLYTYEEACEIVACANRSYGNIPNEAMMKSDNTANQDSI